MPSADPPHDLPEVPPATLPRFPGDFGETTGEYQSAVAQTPEQISRIRSGRRPGFPEIPGYEIVERLGRGGMGVVWLANDTAARRLVAIKQITSGDATDTERQRFVTEFQAMGRMTHPNIARYYTNGECDGEPYFVLEYCPGGTLADYLDRKPQIATVCAEIAEAVARAAQHAHEADIIHRDLKPGNILLAAKVFRDGEASSDRGAVSSHRIALQRAFSADLLRVTDFGLAKKLDTVADRTLGQVRLGTPSYMAPEQAVDAKGVTASADIWSIGVILYETITGSLPFVAASEVGLLDALRHQEPVAPSQRLKVPRDLETICLKCLRKEPKDRYTTAGALADDLRAFREGRPISARRMSRIEKGLRWARKHPRAARALAASVPLAFLVWFLACDASERVPGAAGVQAWLDRRGASMFRPVPDRAKLAARARDLRDGARVRFFADVPGQTNFIRAGAGDDAADPWTRMQATVALFPPGCPRSGPEERRFLERLDLAFDADPPFPAFEPGKGWASYGDGRISGEGIVWANLALSRILASPDLTAGPQQAGILRRLDLAQGALDRYRAMPVAPNRPVGWKLLAAQTDPTRANLYITTMACEALLALRRAGLPWLGSFDERDRLLRDSLEWLTERFTGRGWLVPSTFQEQYNDGFSLHIFSVMLEAEEQGFAEVPDAVAAAIPAALSECRTRTAEHQSAMGFFTQSVLDQTGKPMPWIERKIRAVWLPMAVRCASRWLDRCDRLGLPRDESARTLRVLDHLLSLGPDVLRSITLAEAYVTAELVIGLNAACGP